jgi:acetyl-CoA carboxylase biotin carboxyl carrier protein
VKDRSAPGGARDPLAERERLELRAPVLGVFLRSSHPEEEPLVTVGDDVDAGQTVGFIRVLEETVPLKAAFPGVVTEIHARDRCLVEYDEAVMILQAADQPAVPS